MTDWKRILELCDKATPGPWERDQNDWSVLTPVGDLLDCDVYEECAEFHNADDAAFAVAARTALPEAARAMVALEEWRAELRHTDEIAEYVFDAIARGEGPKR